jgi:diacylglycerol kinase
MRRLLKSFAYALTGICVTFKSEQNFRIHIVAMIIAIVMGLYLKLSMPAWGLVIFSIGFVLVAELFNTAIERLGDETANGKQKQMVKNVKDISAAAVLISALTAFVIGILFLLIPFVQRMVELL